MNRTARRRPLLTASQAETLMTLLETQAAAGTGPHTPLRPEQARALSQLLAEVDVDDECEVELPVPGRNACERCGLYTGTHYCSAAHCNDTGSDVVLCEPCCVLADEQHRKQHDEGRMPCPECGHKGPHEDNGARKLRDRSYLCAGCGMSFDAVPL